MEETAGAVFVCIKMALSFQRFSKITRDLFFVNKFCFQMHRITLLLFVYIVSVNCQFGDEFVNPDPFPLPRTGLLGQGLYPYGQGLGGGAAINNQFGLGNNEFGQGRRGLGRGNQGLGLGQGSINQGLGLGGGIDQTSSLYGQNAGFASIDNGPFGGLPDSGSFAIEKPRRHRPHGERGERGPRPSEIRGSGRNIGEWPVDGTGNYYIN